MLVENRLVISGMFSIILVIEMTLLQKFYMVRKPFGLLIYGFFVGLVALYFF